MTAGSDRTIASNASTSEAYNGTALVSQFVQRMEQNGYDGSKFPASCVIDPCVDAGTPRHSPNILAMSVAAMPLSLR